MSADQGRVLSGDSLRAEAYRLLKEIDPDQDGVSYRDLCNGLLARGFRIGGKAADKAPNVLATISGPLGKSLFVALGGGRYTWQ